MHLAINSGNNRFSETKMHKGFKDYLSDAYPEYKYTVKLAVDKVTDEMLDCMETCLSKYDLKAASKFKDTPIQESPLDFPNIKNSPVFITEITIAVVSKTIKLSKSKLPQQITGSSPPDTSALVTPTTWLELI